MAGIGDELVAALVEGFQLFSHGVIGLRQGTHFAGALHLHAGGQIALAHALDGFGEACDGPGQHS